MTHRLRASKDVARAKSMRLISLLAHPFSSFLFDAVGYKTLALDLVTQEICSVRLGQMASHLTSRLCSFPGWCGPCCV